MYTLRQPLKVHRCTLRLLSAPSAFGLFGLELLVFGALEVLVHLGPRETGIDCWIECTGDSGELGGVNGNTGLDTLLRSPETWIGNLIFIGFTVSSTHDCFGSVGVSGRTVGIVGNEFGDALKSIGFKSQSSPKGNVVSSNGNRNSFHGVGVPMCNSLFSIALGSGHKYRSISSLVCIEKHYKALQLIDQKSTIQVKTI